MERRYGLALKTLLAFTNIVNTVSSNPEVHPRFVIKFMCSKLQGDSSQVMTKELYSIQKLSTNNFAHFLYIVPDILCIVVDTGTKVLS